MSDYISIPIPAEAAYPYQEGARVRIGGDAGDWPGLEDLGIPAGHHGIVIGNGRHAETHARFTERTAGREPNDEDYEMLCDAEGPIVRFDNGKEHWFCGQAMAPLELVN